MKKSAETNMEKSAEKSAGKKGAQKSRKFDSISFGKSPLNPPPSYRPGVNIVGDHHGMPYPWCRKHLGIMGDQMRTSSNPSQHHSTMVSRGWMGLSAHYVERRHIQFTHGFNASYMPSRWKRCNVLLKATNVRPKNDTKSQKNRKKFRTRNELLI